MSVKIACPNGGGEIIKTPTEVNSLDDLIGAVCANCGRILTKDDVIAQARKLAIEKIRELCSFLVYGVSGRVAYPAD